MVTYKHAPPKYWILWTIKIAHADISNDIFYDVSEYSLTKSFSVLLYLFPRNKTANVSSHSNRSKETTQSMPVSNYGSF